jgi:RNA polymerase sigma-70 factor (ECF subfamily)
MAVEMASDGEGFGGLFSDWTRYQKILRRLEKLFQWRGLRDSSELASLTVYRAFIRIIAGADVPEDKMERFLLGVAENIAREAKRDERRYVDVAPFDWPDSEGTTDSAILIAEVLAKLSKSDRELLEMTVWKGTKEIAEELGISEGNARLRIHQARKRVREIARGKPGSVQEITNAHARDISR